MANEWYEKTPLRKRLILKFIDILGVIADKLEKINDSIVIDEDIIADTPLYHIEKKRKIKPIEGLFD